MVDQFTQTVKRTLQRTISSNNKFTICVYTTVTKTCGHGSLLNFIKEYCGINIANFNLNHVFLSRKWLEENV